MIAALILTLATQLLFVKCKRRNNPIATRNVQREDLPEESSEEFELASNEDEVQEVRTPDPDPQPEETVEMITQTEVQQEEPITQTQTQEEDQEGRKIFVTKSGEKHHLNRGCDSLKGYRSYERRACEICKERRQRILPLNPK
jgi:hypothetical protein